jgi:hypothetical protein
MNFNETITKYNYVVFVCRTMQDFISLRKNFTNVFWNSPQGNETANGYIHQKGNISFAFINGMYDGWCHKEWFLQNNITRYSSNEWKIIHWISCPTIIEVDDV